MASNRVKSGAIHYFFYILVQKENIKELLLRHSVGYNASTVRYVFIDEHLSQCLTYFRPIVHILLKLCFMQQIKHTCSQRINFQPYIN